MVSPVDLVFSRPSRGGRQFQVSGKGARAGKGNEVIRAGGGACRRGRRAVASRPADTDRLQSERVSILLPWSKVPLMNALAALLCVAGGGIAAAPGPETPENVVVYQAPGRFGGWPANNGIWSWGDEIVVGFVLGTFKVNPAGGHAIDGSKPSVPHFARSL